MNNKFDIDLNMDRYLKTNFQIYLRIKRVRLKQKETCGEKQGT